MKESMKIRACVEPNDDEEILTEPDPPPGGDILVEGAE